MENLICTLSPALMLPQSIPIQKCTIAKNPRDLSVHWALKLPYIPLMEEALIGPSASLVLAPTVTLVMLRRRSLSLKT
jgi:hypothetical protein